MDKILIPIVIIALIVKVIQILVEYIKKNNVDSFKTSSKPKGTVEPIIESAKKQF